MHGIFGVSIRRVKTASTVTCDMIPPRLASSLGNFRVDYVTVLVSNAPRYTLDVSAASGVGTGQFTADVLLEFIGVVVAEQPRSGLS